MNKKIVISFIFGFLLCTALFSVALFLFYSSGPRSEKFTGTGVNYEKLDSIDVDRIYDYKLHTQEAYGPLLLNNPQGFLEAYKRDREKIFTSIETGEAVFYNFEKMDVFVPFLVRCEIFSDFVSKPEELRANISKYKDIFFIDNTAGVYTSKVIDNYNSYYEKFISDKNFSYEQFFQSLQSLNNGFLDTNEEFAKKLASVYIEFYSQVNLQSGTRTKLDCNKFFTDKVYPIFTIQENK